jgi:hypothetical protein
MGGLQTADLMLRWDSSDWIETSCTALPAWISRRSTRADGPIPRAQFAAILTTAERRSRDPFTGMHAVRAP